MPTIITMATKHWLGIAISATVLFASCPTISFSTRWGSQWHCQNSHLWSISNDRWYTWQHFPTNCATVFLPSRYPFMPVDDNGRYTICIYIYTHHLSSLTRVLCSASRLWRLTFKLSVQARWKSWPVVVQRSCRWRNFELECCQHWQKSCYTHLAYPNRQGAFSQPPSLACTQWWLCASNIKHHSIAPWLWWMYWCILLCLYTSSHSLCGHRQLLVFILVNDIWLW